MILTFQTGVTLLFSSNPNFFPLALILIALSVSLALVAVVVAASL